MVPLWFHNGGQCLSWPPAKLEYGGVASRYPSGHAALSRRLNFFEATAGSDLGPWAVNAL